MFNYICICDEATGNAQRTLHIILLLTIIQKLVLKDTIFLQIILETLFARLIPKFGTYIIAGC